MLLHVDSRNERPEPQNAALVVMGVTVKVLIERVATLVIKGERVGRIVCRGDVGRG